MHGFTTLIHRSILPSLVLAGTAGLAACSGQVDVTLGAGGNGADGSTSSTSTTSTTTSSSTGTGGSGGSTMVPLTCLPGEGAIVVGSSSRESAVAVLNQGVWTGAPGLMPHAGPTAAYADADHQLAIFWILKKDGLDQAHFMRTKDGVAFETHEVKGWHPRVGYGPLVRASDSTLVCGVDQGTGVAYYDSAAMDWKAGPSTSLLPFKVTSAATLATSGAVVLVGVQEGPTRQLCDVTLVPGSAWGAPKCHPELEVDGVRDAPWGLPRLVALPNGDAVAIYMAGAPYHALAAVVLHNGQWSAPVKSTLTSYLALAITTTPAGDVIAGLVFTTMDVAALRFSPATGWAAPIAIDTGATYSRVAAATGICGDDALIAYSTGEPHKESDSEVRVARVRGGTVETTTVGKLVKDGAYNVSLATRLAVQSP